MPKLRVLVVVPWRPQPDRTRIWNRLKPWWEQFGYPIVEADSGDEPFNRGRSQNLGAASEPWDVLVVLDADVVVRRKALEEAITRADESGGIVLPHSSYVPLNADETERWLGSDDLEKPPSGSTLHRGGAVGGVHVVSAQAFRKLQYDGETLPRGQDRRLLVDARSLGIPVERIPGPIIHGYHARPDKMSKDEAFRKAILAIDPGAEKSTVRWLKAQREFRKRQRVGAPEFTPPPPPPLRLPVRSAIFSPDITPRHGVMIRSAYDKEDISSIRLALSKRTLIPSLAAQTDTDFEVIVKVNPDDPHREEREAMFLSLPVPVSFINGTLSNPSFNDTHGLGGDWPRGGPLLQTRVDDDDALFPDFIARLHGASYNFGLRQVLYFPNGLDGPLDDPKPRHYKGNMFPTLYTPEGDSMSVYDVTHNDLFKNHLRVMVDSLPAWTHFRHEHALTSMHRRK